MSGPDESVIKAVIESSPPHECPQWSSSSTSSSHISSLLSSSTSSSSISSSLLSSSTYISSTAFSSTASLESQPPTTVPHNCRNIDVKTSGERESSKGNVPPELKPDKCGSIESGIWRNRSCSSVVNLRVTQCSRSLYEGAYTIMSGVRHGSNPSARATPL